VAVADALDESLGVRCVEGDAEGDSDDDSEFGAVPLPQLSLGDADTAEVRVSATVAVNVSDADRQYVGAAEFEGVIVVVIESEYVGVFDMIGDADSDTVDELDFDEIGVHDDEPVAVRVAVTLIVAVEEAVADKLAKERVAVSLARAEALLNELVAVGLCVAAELLDM
jgi:hypothetical protein